LTAWLGVDLTFNTVYAQLHKHQKSYFLNGWSQRSHAGQTNVTNKQRRENRTAPTGDTVTIATVVMTASTVVIATCANWTFFCSTK